MVEFHMRVAFADIGDFVEFAGDRVRLKSSDEVDTQLIKEVKEGQWGISIKLLDRCTSLEWLDRYFLMNPLDKHKIEYDNKKLELERKKAEPEKPSEGVRYTGIPANMVTPTSPGRFRHRKSRTSGICFSWRPRVHKIIIRQRRSH